MNDVNLEKLLWINCGSSWSCHRRILVYPLRRDVNHFSVYLMVADSLPPYGWSRNTFFKLALINQVDRSKSIAKGILYVLLVLIFLFQLLSIQNLQLEYEVRRVFKNFFFHLKISIFSEEKLVKILLTCN